MWKPPATFQRARQRCFSRTIAMAPTAWRSTAGDVYLQLDRLDEASAIFRAIVNRATSYEERADRMNRMNALSREALERGAIDRAVHVMNDVTMESGGLAILPMPQPALINIGSILKQPGRAEGCAPVVRESGHAAERSTANIHYLRSAKALLSPASLDE